MAVGEEGLRGCHEGAEEGFVAGVVLEFGGPAVGGCSVGEVFSHVAGIGSVGTGGEDYCVVAVVVAV